MTRGKAKWLRELIERLSASLSDEDALTAPELFPAWKEGVEYKSEKDRVRYGDTLYKYIGTAPTVSQSTWTPDVSPSLWVRIDDPGVEYPDWVQPTGATDAYPLGAKVTYNGKHWVSAYANNVWIPGTFGWNEVNE